MRSAFSKLLYMLYGQPFDKMNSWANWSLRRLAADAQSLFPTSANAPGAAGDPP